MNVEKIRKLIEEINLRVTKDHHKMNTKQLSGELREVMEFERNTFQKIEEFEKRSKKRLGNLCQNDL